MRSGLPLFVDYNVIQSFCSLYILFKKVPKLVALYFNVSPLINLFQILCMVISIATNPCIPNYINNTYIAASLRFFTRLFPDINTIELYQFEVLSLITLIVFCFLIYLLFRFLTLRSIWFIWAKAPDFLLFAAVLIGYYFLPISGSILVQSISNGIANSYTQIYEKYTFWVSALFLFFCVGILIFWRQCRSLSIDLLNLPGIEWYPRYHQEIKTLTIAILIEVSHHVPYPTYTYILLALFTIGFFLNALDSLYRPHYILIAHRIRCATVYFTCSIVSLWILINCFIKVDPITTISVAIISLLIFYNICINLENNYLDKLYRKFSKMKTTEDIINSKISDSNFIDQYCSCLSSFKNDICLLEKALDAFPDSYPIALINAKLSILSNTNNTVSSRYVTEMRKRAKNSSTQWMQITLFEMIVLDTNSFDMSNAKAEVALKSALKKFSFSLYLFWTDVHLGRLERLPSLASDVTKKYNDSLLVMSQLHDGWKDNHVYKSTVDKVQKLSNIIDNNTSTNPGIASVMMKGTLSHFKSYDTTTASMETTALLMKETTISMIQDKGKITIFIFQHIGSYIMYYICICFLIYVMTFTHYGIRHPYEWNMILRGTRLAELANSVIFSYTWSNLNLSQEIIDKINDHVGQYANMNLFFGNGSYIEPAEAYKNEIIGFIQLASECAEEYICVLPPNTFPLVSISNDNISLDVRLSVLSDNYDHIDESQEAYEIARENSANFYYYMDDYLQNFSRLLLEDITVTNGKIIRDFGIVLCVMFGVMLVFVIVSGICMNRTFSTIFSNFLVIPKPFVSDLISKIQSKSQLNQKQEILDANENYHLQQLEHRISPSEFVSNNQRIVFMIFHAIIVYLFFAVVSFVYLLSSINSQNSNFEKHSNTLSLLEIPIFGNALGYRLTDYIKEQSPERLEKIKIVFERLQRVSEDIFNNSKTSLINQSILFQKLDMSNRESFSIHSTLTVLLASMSDFIERAEAGGFNMSEEILGKNYEQIFTLILLTSEIAFPAIDDGYLMYSNQSILRSLVEIVSGVFILWIIFMVTLTLVPMFMPVKHFTDIVLSSGTELFTNSPEWFISTIENGKIDASRKYIDEKTIDYLYDMIMYVGADNKILYAPDWMHNRIEINPDDTFPTIIERITGKDIYDRVPPTRKEVITLDFLSDHAQEQLILTLLPVEFTSNGKSVKYVAVLKDTTIMNSIINQENKELKLFENLVNQLVPNQVANTIINGQTFKAFPCKPFVGSFMVEKAWSSTKDLQKKIQELVNKEECLTFLGRSVSTFRVAAGLFGKWSEETTATTLINFAANLVKLCRENGGKIKICLASLDDGFADLVTEPSYNFDILSVGFMSLTEATARIPSNAVVYSTDIFNAVFDEDIDSMFIGEIEYGTKRMKLFKMQDVQNYL